MYGRPGRIFKSSDDDIPVLPVRWTLWVSSCIRSELDKTVLEVKE